MAFSDQNKISKKNYEAQQHPTTGRWFLLDYSLFTLIQTLMRQFLLVQNKGSSHYKVLKNLKYHKFQKWYFPNRFQGLLMILNCFYQGIISTEDFEVDQTLLTNISSESSFNLEGSKISTLYTQKKIPQQVVKFYSVDTIRNSQIQNKLCWLLWGNVMAGTKTQLTQNVMCCLKVNQTSWCPKFNFSLWYCYVVWEFIFF